jgi:uncharacterized protein YggU (UPF0235/DUF167 family)
MTAPPIRPDGSDVLLEVRVQPRASRNEICWRAGCLLVRLTAPPVEGAATLACRALLADLLGLPKSRVIVLRGETARQKLLRLQGIDIASARARLSAPPDV